MKLTLTLFLSLFITQANATQSLIVCETTLSQETQSLLKSLSYDQALKQAKPSMAMHKRNMHSVLCMAQASKPMKTNADLLSGLPKPP